ncbi:GNAT family N-acetyltransferase [Brachybacterium sp. UMB0905]|uniref:GNAT family N-acetyltransferase n=1 Tax=Brachybacterium sp. UMB0905 TaxID=2069310 RepID=UPI000C80774F|nr:GNAT family protein [Brachybacterium sp. UMB0905]PMC74610.1 RimJ/RimL family protein N-acetyltransferase [Brachybacterium sp. UMB0905]
MVHVWPLVLRDEELVLRPLRRRDRGAYERLRARNAQWLRPWDATDPEHPGHIPDFRSVRRWGEQQAKDGTHLPLALTVNGQLAGQITAGPIQYGALRSATLGYWIDHERAGQGLVPRAAALLMDHLFAELGLHRIEVTVRPENAASLRVVEKLQLRPEGLRRSAIHVDGAWRDHLVFALTAEDARLDLDGRGVLRRLKNQMRHQNQFVHRAAAAAEKPTDSPREKEIAPDTPSL